MPSKVIKLRQPEGGAEYWVLHERPHRCAQANADRSLDDTIIFPVGLYGWEMPIGIPFQVTALGECDACGRLLTAWFEWTGSQVLL